MKEIRNHLYNIENKNELENSNEYLNELDKKIIKLSEYNNNNNDDDFIENLRDLFNIVNYEPILIKTGFNNNYLEYRSEGNDSLSFEEYLNFIKPYLNEVIKVLFKSLLQKFQENLQEKMKGSDFTFDGINYLYYDLNKVSISKGGSYIDSPKWLKNKKSTINPKNNDYKCFQYTITLALNYDKIDRNPSKNIKN